MALLNLWMEPETIRRYAMGKYGRQNWARRFLSELSQHKIQTLLFDVKIPTGVLYFPSQTPNAVVSSSYHMFLPEMCSAAETTGTNIYARIVCFLDFSDNWKVDCAKDKSGDPQYGKICPTNANYRQYLLDIVREVLELKVKGVVLDAIEFVDPDSTGTDLDADLCFCESCGRKLYTEFEGDFAKWIRWRCEQINSFVEQVELLCRAQERDVLLGVEVDFDQKREYDVGLRIECGIDLLSVSQIVDFLIFHINALSRVPLNDETRARRLSRVLNCQIQELKELLFFDEARPMKFYISAFGLTANKCAQLQNSILDDVQHDGLFLHVPLSVNNFVTDFASCGGRILE